MKIVCSMFTSWTRENVIEDALKSVIDWVDAVVLVHGMGGEDGTLEVAKRVCGDKLVVREFSEFGDIHFRNAVLRAAEDTGADWCVLLDTDERFVYEDISPRDILADIPEDLEAVMLRDTSQSYTKVMAIRLPAKGTWESVVHERYIYKGEVAVVERQLSFYELKKTPEQLRLRSEIDLKYLEKQLQEDPEEYRWLFYRASCLELLGRAQEAFDAYLEGSRKNITRSRKAALLYEAARMAYLCGNKMGASRLCLESIFFCPKLAEAYCLLGVICNETGLHDDACAWFDVARLNRNHVLDILFRDSKLMDSYL